jgi:hypothetical protein
MGHCNGNYWMLEKAIDSVFFAHGPNGSAPENDAAYPVRFLRMFASEPLRLGLPCTNWQDLTWEGNDFAFASNPVVGRGTFRGRVVLDNQERITSAEYRLYPDRMRRIWRLAYDYESSPDIPPGFPSALRCGMVEEGKPERHLSETRILSLVLATNQMPETAFQPEQYLNVPRVFEVLLSNDTRYVRAGDGWAKQPGDPAARSDRAGLLGVVFKVSAALVALAAVLVSLRLIRLGRSAK